VDQKLQIKQVPIYDPKFVVKELSIMRTNLLALLFLLPLTLSALLVANLSERSCIQTDFDSKLTIAEDDSTFCLYSWNSSGTNQQLKLKRLHANGNQDDEVVLYDFGAAYYHLGTPYISSNRLVMLFSNAQSVVCLIIQGEAVQAYNLSWADHAGLLSGGNFLLLGNSLLFIGIGDDLQESLWKWEYESGECSLIYNPGTLFYGVRLSLLGNRPVLCEAQPWSYYSFGQIPQVLFDEEYNPIIQYSHISLWGCSYRFDEQTFYANWFEQEDSNNNGVVYVSGNTLEYYTWAGTGSLDEWSEGYHPLFELPGGIHAVRYSHGGITGSFTRYELWQDPGPGNLIPYTAMGNLNVYPDTLRYVGKMHERLLTIGYGTGPFVFRLADIQASQWADFNQNQWTPQETGGWWSRAYNSNDYVLMRIQSQDENQNPIQRYYFLKVEQSVSSDDPINPPQILNAHPNPFRDYIRISSKSMDGRQSLHIYNLRGQKVRSLAAKADGYEWDGRDEHGKPLAAGIYFARDPHSDSTIKLLKLKR
jgi:hypothetical protein